MTLNFRLEDVSDKERLEFGESESAGAELRFKCISISEAVICRALCGVLGNFLAPLYALACCSYPISGRE